MKLLLSYTYIYIYNVYMYVCKYIIDKNHYAHNTWLTLSLLNIDITAIILDTIFHTRILQCAIYT